MPHRVKVPHSAVPRPLCTRLVGRQSAGRVSHPNVGQTGAVPESGLVSQHRQCLGSIVRLACSTALWSTHSVAPNGDTGQEAGMVYGP